ncbi:hypothetical protein Pfo_009955 [Paulownia fortunei]|nr:hypothetical protein Pfo_009955 [Paulownia fortunei]
MNPTENPIKISSDEEDDHCHSQYAMQLVNASVLPMVMKACIELDVLDIIRRAGPNAQLSPSQIASQLPCLNPDAAASLLDCMLGLLASFQRLYSLAPVSKYFLGNANGVSLAPLLQANQDKIMNGYEDAYIVKNPSYLQLFKALMTNYNSMFMEKILETYKGFEGLKSIVDVGGGDGIEHVAGDMFISIPKGDAIFLKVSYGFLSYLLHINGKLDKSITSRARCIYTSRELSYKNLMK